MFREHLNCLEIVTYNGNGTPSSSGNPTSSPIRQTYHTPNSILIDVFENTLDLTPLPNQVCQITGEEAMGIQTSTMKIFLRPDIIQRLILLALIPQEQKVILELFPNEHYVHGDFYNDHHQPIQPKGEFLPAHYWYIPAKDKQTQQDNLKTQPEIDLSDDLGLG